MQKIVFSFCVLFSMLKVYATPIHVVEVRYDLGAGTRGASLAPNAIRIAAINDNDPFFKNHKRTTIAMDSEKILVKNPYFFANYIQHQIEINQKVADTVSQKVKNGLFTLVLAGDHSTASGTIAGIKQAFPNKRLGVVWIDAHADIHTPFTTPSGNIHGMPLAVALNDDNRRYQKNKIDCSTAAMWRKLKSIGGHEAKLKSKDLIYVAVRDIEQEEKAKLRDEKIRNYPTNEIQKRGAHEVAMEILANLASCDIIYISFDVDGMDPSVSHGTGTPVKDGIRAIEANELITTLVKSNKVCCLEIAEVNPLLDKGNKMAEAAFTIIKNSMGHVERR